MAKTIVTTTEYTDDLSGGKADSTTAFSFDGTSYEIDLSKANARAFEKVIQPYVSAGRRVRSGRRPSRSGRRSASGKYDLAAVRAWAKDAGYKVSDRGRVAQEVFDAYESAH
jgi:hypothetical protein